jgi:hypothetical protein
MELSRAPWPQRRYLEPPVPVYSLMKSTVWLPFTLPLPSEIAAAELPMGTPFTSTASGEPADLIVRGARPVRKEGVGDAERVRHVNLPAHAGRAAFLLVDDFFVHGDAVGRGVLDLEIVGLRARRDEAVEAPWNALATAAIVVCLVHVSDEPATGQRAVADRRGPHFVDTAVVRRIEKRNVGRGTELDGLRTVAALILVRVVLVRAGRAVADDDSVGHGDAAFLYRIRAEQGLAGRIRDLKVVVAVRQARRRPRCVRARPAVEINAGVSALAEIFGVAVDDGAVLICGENRAGKGRCGLRHDADAQGGACETAGSNDCLHGSSPNLVFLADRVLVGSIRRRVTRCMCPSAAGSGGSLPHMRRFISIVVVLS